jgi:hypothetical protein
LDSCHTLINYAPAVRLIPIHLFSVVIPFELSQRGHIFLRARVNNSEPLWFILDSGSGDTVLNRWHELTILKETV